MLAINSENKKLKRNALFKYLSMDVLKLTEKTRFDVPSKLATRQSEPIVPNFFLHSRNKARVYFRANTSTFFPKNFERK